MVLGRLTVIHQVGILNGQATWLCKCECGNEKVIRGHSLRDGTKSCGCLIREINKILHTRHGLSESPTYVSWHSMKIRCLNMKARCSKCHGKRGITICNRWLNSFENFVADVGERPTLAHTLDRKDVNGNYEPENCFWATKKEQGRNRRTNVFVEINGVSKCIAEWAEINGIDRGVLRNRIKSGWPQDQWFTPKLSMGGKREKGKRSFVSVQTETK